MKNYKALIEKAKKLQAQRAKRKTDRKYLQAIGFLKAKGFLFDETILPKPNVKLDLHDVLWVADHVEPRVYEVLPAAMTHFPKTFFNTAVAPKDLQDVLDALKQRKDLNESYHGTDFKKIKHWVERQPKDKRVRPLGEKKITRTFRFNPALVQKLTQTALANGTTETAVLENLIEGIDP